MDILALTKLAVVAVGLAGTVISGLPGVLLVFGAAAVYAVVSRFQGFGTYRLCDAHRLLPLG